MLRQLALKRSLLPTQFLLARTLRFQPAPPHLHLIHSHPYHTTRPTMSKSNRQLKFNDGPMVWIDCEMTGLDPNTERLLEIAVVITNGNLEPVDEGIQFIIKTDKAVLDNMNDWCVQQHGSSGLTQACLDSPHDRDYVAGQVLSYIRKRVPEQRSAVLAGNSVHADRAFLVKEMPAVVDWLHYRIVDVSSIKELCRRWYPHHSIAYQKLNTSHRALDDIMGSIRELRWYRNNIFVPISEEDRFGNEVAEENVMERKWRRNAGRVVADVLSLDNTNVVIRAYPVFKFEQT